MSNGALDRPTFETIEAYVLDRMSATDRAAFEQRMATDPALRSEVEMERENIHAVELGGMERMLKGIAAEEHHAPSTGMDWSRYLKYAAAIALLAGAASWWMLRTPLNERLFAEHFVADSGLPVSMGVADDPAFSDAMVSYKEGKYAEARAKWMPLLQQEPQNDTLLYYMASAHLAEGDANAAISLLDAVSNEPGSAFQRSSKWFLFLAYVRTGDAVKAGAISFADDPDHEREAQVILQQLR